MARRLAAAIALTLWADPVAAEPLSLLDQDLAALVQRLARADVDLGIAPAVSGNPAALRRFDVAPPPGAGPRTRAAASESRRVLGAAMAEPTTRAEPTALEIFRARDRRLTRRPAAAVLIDPAARRLLR